MYVVSLVFMAIFAQSPAKPPAELRLPYYDWNACPFECCVYRTWKADKAIKILQERRLNSPVAFELRRGDAVQAVTGVVVTTRAGELRILADRSVGSTNIRVRAGDVVRILRPQGEGHWKIWFDGRTDTEELLNLGDLQDTSVRVMSRPEITWWVKVRTPDGRVGWTTATQDFDGTDACG